MNCHCQIYQASSLSSIFVIKMDQCSIRDHLNQIISHTNKTPSELLKIIKSELRQILLDKIPENERDVKIPILYSAEHGYFQLSHKFKTWMKEQISRNQIEKRSPRHCYEYISLFGLSLMKEFPIRANQWYCINKARVSIDVIRKVMSWHSYEGFDNTDTQRLSRGFHQDYDDQKKEGRENWWIRKARESLIRDLKTNSETDGEVESSDVFKTLWSLRGVSDNDIRWGEIILNEENSTFVDIFDNNSIKPIDQIQLKNTALSIGMRLAHAPACCSLSVRYVLKSHGYVVGQNEMGREYIRQADPLDKNNEDLYDEDAFFDDPLDEI